MPTFTYVAKKGPTELTKGVLEGESRQAVLSRLADLGYTPISITEAVVTAEAQAHAAPAPAAARLDGRVPVRVVNQFTRQFASLVRAQVPMLRTLGILNEQTSHPRLTKILGAISEDLRQGDTLSGALAKYPQVFSPLYVSLARAGEVAGILDAVLDRLAEQADREEALRAKVQAAVMYPAFVLLVGIGTVIFLLTFVMPRLIKLFAGFGGRLPLPTRMLLTVTAWCQSPWFWTGVAVVIGGAVVACRAHKTAVRLALDRVSLSLPMLGTLVRRLELARFARAYGLLLNHGIPILQATDVAIPVVRNSLIQRELARLPAGLKDGTSLAVCLKSLSMATPFMVHAVAVGEEGGRVGEALVEVANYYEREAERLLQTMASLLEPLMILTVGGMVGFIVMAVLLPIFDMSVLAR
jgi:type II secretory pathway component PulF